MTKKTNDQERRKELDLSLIGFKYSFFNDPLLSDTGYKPKTTFWLDFSIAEPFGKDTVIETYEEAKKSWADNIEYMTELAMVLNHKCWRWAGKFPVLAKLYDDLWRDAEKFIFEHYKDDKKAIQYYLEVTD